MVERIRGVTAGVSGVILALAKERADRLAAASTAPVAPAFALPPPPARCQTALEGLASKKLSLEMLTERRARASVLADAGYVAMSEANSAGKSSRRLGVSNRSPSSAVTISPTGARNAWT